MVKAKQDDKNIVNTYKRNGIIAAAVLAVAILGAFAISYTASNSDNSEDVVVEEVIAESATKADTKTPAKAEKATTAPASELRIGIVNMGTVVTEGKVLKDLQKQRLSYETKLKNELEKIQKDLEKEKSSIEKSQDILSQEALQRRVIDLQQRANNAQRELAEKAQAIEVSYQEALNKVQKDYLDPIIQSIVKKQKISLVIDAAATRMGTGAGVLDITKDVVKNLDKKVSSVKMGKPKGF